MDKIIDSQTEKWINFSSEIDTSDLERFLKEFNKNYKEKTFYHYLYDIIEEYYLEWKKIIEIGWQFWGNLYILNKWFDKTLLDLDYVAINKAKEIFKKNNINASFIVWDMFSMPIEENTFDIAFNSWVLEHFTEDERISALKDYSRILKKGWVMVLAVPNHNSYFYRFYYLFLNFVWLWKIPKEFKIKNFNNEISKNNLKLVETKIVCPEVIFDNYNNLFWLWTFLSALYKIFRKNLDVQTVMRLNKKYWLWNLIRIINYFYKIDWYLITFIIKKP